MAHDPGLAQRIREQLQHLAPHAQVVEKRMFGGLAFMVNTHMSVGVVRDTLMVRTGPQAYAAALQKPHVRPMDFTGKPLTGFVFVQALGLAEDDDLAAWVRLACDFTATLPPKPARPAGAKTAKPATAAKAVKATKRPRTTPQG